VIERILTPLGVQARAPPGSTLAAAAQVRRCEKLPVPLLSPLCLRGPAPILAAGPSLKS